MKLYLAGPMSGLPQFNHPAFHAAAAKLRMAGHHVVNPAEINTDLTARWADCMRRDLAELLTCGGVALLPGWKFSRGATLEVRVAQELGMECSPFETWALSERSAA